MLTVLLLGASTIAIGVLALRTAMVLRRYPVQAIDLVAVEESPTVSVCIAARNETHALAQCLERVLKSDYVKLEVLVLDDSSSDDTSLIIKSFANAGVRFIPGKQLPAGWLGKNHAYKTLADEASGDLLLYIDVDTTLSTSTITQLVEQLTSANVSMISVLPRREDTERWSAMAGTMRYYWELLLGTRKSPPASSAIWMVRSDKLREEGIGLENYGMSVRPERHLARQLARQDSYRYLIGTSSLGVAYEKHLRSQYETALRLYYPATGRSIARWLLCSVYLVLILIPLVVLLAEDGTFKVGWSLILIAITAATFGLFVRRTYGGAARMLRVVLGPLLVIQELVLLTLSYWKYRLGAVTWKGRLVNAQPVNHDALEIKE